MNLTRDERRANVEYMKRLARKAREVNPVEVLRRTQNRVTVSWVRPEFNAYVESLRSAADRLRRAR